MTDLYRLDTRTPRSGMLTPRETEVLYLIADGNSGQQIAKILTVSHDTVKTTVMRMRRKLGAKDRAHAVAQGFRAGVLR